MATTTQTSTSSLPSWMESAAQNLIGKGEALTDVNANPYQQYGGERIAQFTPLQNQAFGNAANIGPTAATGMGQGIAGLASFGALNTGYNPYQTGQFNMPTAVQYMSPFVQSALAPQLREAARNSDILRNQQQAQAVSQGAFGGSRQAIVEAERQRNLGQQQQDIMDRGYQQAFDQARQQFNTEQQLREQSRQYGAGLGLQGLQTALSGAGQLGTLGQQQFQQGVDATKLQAALGSQQQGQVQQGLDIDYQDFLARQQYPYQQLQFMSNLIRGTPTSTSSTAYTTTPSPSTGSQLLGAGTSLLGAYMMGGGTLFKQGGQVKSGGAGLADLAVSKV